MTDAEAAACHCQVLRQATRRVTAVYDAALAPLGLRVSQFSILSRLHQGGPRNIRALAAEMVMDRTTLGRTLRPLERDGLLQTRPDPADGRSRVLTVTPAGVERLGRAVPAWEHAQRAFEARYGTDRAAALRTTLHGVITALDPATG